MHSLNVLPLNLESAFQSSSNAVEHANGRAGVHKPASASDSLCTYIVSGAQQLLPGAPAPQVREKGRLWLFKVVL